MAVTILDSERDARVRAALESLDHLIEPNRNMPEEREILVPLRRAVVAGASAMPPGTPVSLPSQGGRRVPASSTKAAKRSKAAEMVLVVPRP